MDIPREEDGAIEFWRLKIVFGTNLRTLSIGLMKCARAKWEAVATIKDFNVVLINQDKKFFTSKLFKVIQDAISLIFHYRTLYKSRTDFFEYIYHIGCAISLHTITNSRVDSQGGHCTGIHDRFLRDPVYRESQLAIGWTEQECKEMDELAKEDHTYHLSTEEFERYQGQWYPTLNKSGKNGPMRTIFELLSLSKTVSTASQANKLQNQFLQDNTGDGILLQALHGGTRLNGIGSELIRFFFSAFFFTVGFVYSR